MPLTGQTRVPPALLPAAAFLLGVAWAPGRGYLSILAAGVASALTAAVTRGKHGRLLLVLSCLGAGMLAGAADEDRGRLARQRWLPTSGEPWEGHVAGKVLRSPERGHDGSWRFRAAIRPSPDPSPGAPMACVRLTVAPGLPGAESGSPMHSLRAGDRIRIWCRLRWPRRPGNPGQKDSRLTLSARGDDATGWVKSPLIVRRTGEEPLSLERFLDTGLAWARQRLDRSLTGRGEARALVGAMLLGDRDAVSPDVEAAFRGAGISHLMAISGLHVGIVAGLLVAACPPLRRHPWTRALIMGIALWGFAVMVGGRAPVSRAVLMVLLALGARVIQRPTDSRNSLVLAAACLIAWHPPWIHHVGFRLSVAAVAGIVTLGPRLVRPRWAPWPLPEMAAVSLSAYAATAPLVAAEFHQLAPSAIWTNPPAVATGTFVVAGALLTILLADVPWLGATAGDMTTASCALLTALARWASAIPASSVRVPAPPSVVWAVLLACWAPIALRCRMNSGVGRFAAAGFLFAMAWIHIGTWPHRGDRLSIAVLDVGQGQSIVLLGPAGRCALVDSGGSSGGRYDLGDRVVVPSLLEAGCKRIDVLALSHGHDDHSGGAVAVIRGLDVGELWIPRGSIRDVGIRAAAEAAWERGVAVRSMSRGGERKVAGWWIRVVHPGEADHGLSINDRGLALWIEAAEGARLFIPGDLEKDGERRMTEARKVPEASAMIAGHHGARNSNGERWLDSVGAHVFVVSCGFRNRFGHPHREVRQRFAALGGRVYRTDLDGQVRLIPTGIEWTVETTVRRDAGERE